MPLMPNLPSLPAYIEISRERRLYGLADPSASRE